MEVVVTDGSDDGKSCSEGGIVMDGGCDRRRAVLEVGHIHTRYLDTLLMDVTWRRGIGLHQQSHLECEIKHSNE